MTRAWLVMLLAGTPLLAQTAPPAGPLSYPGPDDRGSQQEARGQAGIHSGDRAGEEPDPARWRAPRPPRPGRGSVL